MPAVAVVACIVTTSGCLQRASDGVLDASWAAPTTNADGSPLIDLMSYRVYYSTTNPPCPGGQFLTVTPSTPDRAGRVTLTGLTVGQRYYVSIAAVNSRGVGSCSPVSSALARRK